MARLAKRETPVVRPSEHTESVDVFGSIDRAFETMFDRLPFMPWRWPVAARHWLTESFIPVNEYYQDGSLVIRAEIPGIDSNRDVELTLADGMLHIKAQRQEEEKVEEESYLRKEMRYGSFERTLPLPPGVTETDVKATYANGILEIVIPKVEFEPAKRIPISQS